MKKIIDFLKKSVLLENPALSLFAGITPLLAVSTRLLDGVALGVCAIFCITLSSLLFRVLRKAISDKLRDVVYILIVAAVVGLCEILLLAFLPSIYKNLGIYLPLLAVSGLVFSRSKKFSSEEKLGKALLGGLSCGIGYFVLAVALSLVREFFGRGAVAGFAVIPEKYAMSLLISPVGGFMLFGILIAVFRSVFANKSEEEE